MSGFIHGYSLYSRRSSKAPEG